MLNFLRMTFLLNLFFQGIDVNFLANDLFNKSCLLSVAKERKQKKKQKVERNMESFPKYLRLKTKCQGIKQEKLGELRS